MSRIYWDTMLFVYWLEEDPKHLSRVSRILEKMEERGDRLCTSVFTIGEVLTGAYRSGDLNLASGIRTFFGSPLVEILPFTPETADRYAEIRSRQRVSSPDAIHLATAAQNSIDLFLTNDRQLSKLVIPGIQFIAGIDVNLF